MVVRCAVTVGAGASNDYLRGFITFDAWSIVGNITSKTSSASFASVAYNSYSDVYETASRQPKCFVFSSNFVGWVTVEYHVKGAESLPVRDGCLWLDFRQRNKIQTKSEIEQGWATDRYLEGDGDQLRQLGSKVEGRSVQEHLYQFTGLYGIPDSSIEYLFIGTTQQRLATPSPVR